MRYLYPDMEPTQSSETGDGSTDQSISRRGCLQSIGVVIGVPVVSETTTASTASSDGFGQGGYGRASYGGTGVAVATDAATDMTDTSATLTGSLTDLDGASTVEVYFEYRPVGADTWTATASQTLSSTESFSASISGLTEGTEYAYRPVVSGDDDEAGIGTAAEFVAGDSSAAIGETGAVSTTQSGSDEWHQVTLDGTYADPVVVMTPPSFDGSHPSHVRLRNVGNDSFEFKIETWRYLDGWHTSETIHYLVVDAGSHELEDGTRLEAGVTTRQTDFSRTSFSQNFSSKPVVFSQSQTYNGSPPIITRNKEVTTDGFTAKLQEAEGSDGRHTEETVGYIAVVPNTGTNGERAYETRRTDNTVTDDWHTISFDQSYADPLLVADIQTVDGWQPAGVRYRNLTANGVEIFIQEEQSEDQETNHISEVVGIAVFDGSGSISGT